jgi:hypothetical protein
VYFHGAAKAKEVGSAKLPRCREKSNNGSTLAKKFARVGQATYFLIRGAAAQRELLITGLQPSD